MVRKQAVQHEPFKMSQNSFDQATDVKYLNTARIAATNRGYYTLKYVFKSRNISINTQLGMYETVLRPITVYRVEEWTKLKWKC